MIPFTFQCTQTGSVAVFPVGPSRTSSSTQPNTSTAPTLSTLPPNTSPSSRQPPIPLIIGAVIIGLVVLTLLLLVPVLLLKYHQLRLGKRGTHLDNPKYEGERTGEGGSLEVCGSVRKRCCQGQALVSLLGFNSRFAKKIIRLWMLLENSCLNF